jgi:hypothetical protein
LNTTALVFENILSAAASSALIGEAGIIYENLVGYVDAGDRNSYPGSGAAVTDIEGNLTDGLLTTATYSDGAFQFDGASGDLTFTKGAAVDDIFDGGGTIMVVFRPDTDGEGSLGRIATTEGAGSAGWRLMVASESGTAMRIRFEREFDTTDGDWTTDDIDGSRPVPEGSWTVAAVTYDDNAVGNDPTVYLNAIPATLTEVTTPNGTAVTDVGEDLIVGNRAADNVTFDGEIAILLMWDRELTQREVTQVTNTLASRYGSVMQGQPSVTSARHGQSVVIAAGDYVVGSGVSRGGNVVVRAGSADSNSASADGGDAFFLGGDGINLAVGGGVTCKGGSGAGSNNSEFGAGDSTSGVAAGVAEFHGGDNLSTGAAGNGIFRGGNCTDAGSGNDNGGDVLLLGGQQRGGGDPGNVFVRALGPSDATASSTGDIEIVTDAIRTTGPIGTQGGTATDTGSIRISTAAPGATANVAGNIDIIGGTTSATTGNDPGAVNITAGSMNNAAQNNVAGAAVTITAGDSIGGSASPGGPVVLNGGNQTDATSSSDGGNVELNGGTAADTGRAGDVVSTAGTNSGTGLDGSVQDLTNGAVDPCETRTLEVQTVNSTANNDFPVALLAADGDFVSVEVMGCGMTSGGGTPDFYSRKIITSFYIDGGTITEIGTRHLDNTQTVGTVTGWAIDAVISGSNIVVRINGPATGTVNFSVIAKVKSRTP